MECEMREKKIIVMDTLQGKCVGDSSRRSCLSHLYIFIIIIIVTNDAIHFFGWYSAKKNREKQAYTQASLYFLEITWLSVATKYKRNKLRRYIK